MKTKILVENCGKYVKVKLVKDQDQIAHNMFANLAWLCKERHLPEETGNFTMFMTEKDKFTRLVKAYKDINKEEAFEVTQVSRNDMPVSDYRPHVYALRGMSFQRLQHVIGEGYES